MLSAKCRYLPLVLLLHHLQLTYHVSTATVSSLPWLPTLRGKTGNTLASRGRLLAHVVEEGGDYECQDGSPPVPGNANSYNYQYGIIRSEELTVEEAATTCKTIPKCMGFSVDIPPEDLVGCYTWCDTVKHTIQFRWRLQDISTDTFHSDTIATTCLLKKEARPFTSANDYDTIQLSGWRFEVHKDNTKNIPFTHGPNTKIIERWRLMYASFRHSTYQELLAFWEATLPASTTLITWQMTFARKFDPAQTVLMEINLGVRPCHRRRHHPVHLSVQRKQPWLLTLEFGWTQIPSP